MRLCREVLHTQVHGIAEHTHTHTHTHIYIHIHIRTHTHISPHTLLIIFTLVVFFIHYN